MGIGIKLTMATMPTSDKTNSTIEHDILIAGKFKFCKLLVLSVLISDFYIRLLKIFKTLGSTSSLQRLIYRCRRNLLLE